MIKEITKEEWIVIAKKAKEIDEKLIELSVLLSEKLPQEFYLKKMKSARKSFGNLRGHLDVICNGEYIDDPNKIVQFFGIEEK